MSKAAHGERIAQLEAKGEAERDRLDRLVAAVDRYVAEGQESRKEHERQHQEERAQHSEDHGRIHKRIDGLPAEAREAAEQAVAPALAASAKALTTAESVAQTVRDARIFLKGGKASLVAVGIALYWILEKAWDWLATGIGGRP